MSEALGQGIETWGLAGSSPDIWEEWQQQRPFSNTTIIGVSVYDLNEMHVAPDRANVVPLLRTINDLRASGTDSVLSHRLLTQYFLKYVRALFPTAGDADKDLVKVRAKVADQLGIHTNLAKREDIVFEPSPPLLDAGESTAMVSEWSSGRVLRRIAALRAESQGRHEFFNGPKRMAFHRLLFRARQQGRVIVVVLPVTKQYREELLDEGAVAAFERELQEAMAIVPMATIVRLDRVPGISDPGYFSDLVHMNSFGRSVATRVFLMEVTKGESQRTLNAATTASITSGK